MHFGTGDMGEVFRQGYAKVFIFVYTSVCGRVCWQALGWVNEKVIM